MKSSGFVEDKRVDNFEGFDEGILRGKWKEKFLTPHISPWGSGSTEILCVTEIYRPNVRTKYWPPEFKWGYRGCSQ